MRASKQERTAAVGVSEVCAKFQRIGWGPVPNKEHDLGTDLLVQARDRRRFDRGLIVGAQIKGGPRWFRDPEHAPDGAVLGWWYYESHTSHFDDWVTHGLPHLLVLHDLDENVSYWVHVTADRVTRTGKGCKILVPAEQTIDADHVDDLLGVAALQKAAPSIEGTSFHASSSAIPPARRLRYAMVSPRLVAPHRNAGYEVALSPEEAIALCCQGRLLDLRRFAEKHDVVPDPRQPYTGRDWRWTFVRSFWTWATEDDISTLERAWQLAPDSEGRAAAGVLTACALRRVERQADAIEVLDHLVAKDDLNPVDHGWVLVQRARLRADVGAVRKAREDAVEAQRQFSGDADDITVSALAGAAAWLLFTTADFGSGALAETLTASDTAVAWWRSQTISSALREAADRAYRVWAQDSANRWSAEDAEAINLFAAELNADLTGEHGTWRAVAALQACQAIMRSHENRSDGDVAAGLRSLRRSGDHRALNLALEHLRLVGPATAMATALGEISINGWTHTTAKANLEFLARAGDLMSESTADKWVTTLAGIFLDDGDFVEQVQPTFMVSLAVAEAIDGVLPAAGSAGRLRASQLLATQRTPIDDVLATKVSEWVRELSFDDVPSQVRDDLRRLAVADHGRVGARILGWLARSEDPAAKQEVHERALTGDLEAISAMGDVTLLSANQAATLIGKFDSMVRHAVAQAEASMWSFGGFDAGAGLALFNVSFPDVARWDPLLELLTHPAVASEDKRRPLELLVELIERVPAEVHERLASDIDQIAESRVYADVGGRSIRGLASSLGIVTGAIAEDAADVTVARLALGSEQDRRDAASLLARGSCARMRPLLASFVADRRASVRVSAAGAVGRIVSSAPDQLLIELARRVAADPGVVVPAALLHGLSRGDNANEVGHEIATSLMHHPSARVRRLASELAHVVA